MPDLSTFSAELLLLLGSLVLHALYLGTQAILYRLQYGVMFAATARDEEAPPGVLLARAERALRNFLETWPGFIALVVIIELSGRNDALTFWGAQIWFWCRLLYLPLYLSGVFMLRSLVWFASACGLFLMFLGIVF
ncbi:MAG: MAPEG family protein [Devosia sp.]